MTGLNTCLSVTAVCLLVFSASAATAQQAYPPNLGLKVCSVYYPNNWRDSMNVPAAWTNAMCAAYKSQVGATQYQLGCLSATGLALGTQGGGKPTPNCGW